MYISATDYTLFPKWSNLHSSLGTTSIKGWRVKQRVKDTSCWNRKLHRRARSRLANEGKSALRVGVSQTNFRPFAGRVLTSGLVWRSSVVATCHRPRPRHSERGTGSFGIHGELATRSSQKLSRFACWLCRAPYPHGNPNFAKSIEAVLVPGMRGFLRPALRLVSFQTTSSPRYLQLFSRRGRARLSSASLLLRSRLLPFPVLDEAGNEKLAQENYDIRGTDLIDSLRNNEWSCMFQLATIFRVSEESSSVYFSSELL